MERVDEFRTGCLLCGAELLYDFQPKKKGCMICGMQQETNVTCSLGHYVCDDCHSLPGGDFIQLYTTKTGSIDPLELASTLMRDRRLSMHGPEHHFLVPAVLLASYYNLTLDFEKKEKQIQLARSRAAQVPGGFCGTHGDCGAAVGVGIFVSLVTGATPLSHQQWHLCNIATARALTDIAENGGPRCCKRNTFLAIRSAAGFIRSRLGAAVPEINQIHCEFSSLNKQCIRNRCPFFSGDDKPQGKISIL